MLENGVLRRCGCQVRSDKDTDRNGEMAQTVDEQRQERREGGISKKTEAGVTSKLLWVSTLFPASGQAWNHSTNIADQLLNARTLTD